MLEVAGRQPTGALLAGRLQQHWSLRSWSLRQALVWVALGAMMLAYALPSGTLALRRHWNLESQALDMGYADQITWNMTQVRLFRFTVFRDQVGAELGRPLQFGPGADRDSLLAFHTEFLFLPLALLYLVHPGPETLIVLLTTVLALGAVPVYLLARHFLRHRGAALAFAAVYLLFPSVQAANLADFHLVSMAPAFLLWTLYFLVAGRPQAFIILAVASALLKEEVGLLVAAIGVYAWLALGQRRLGLAVAGASLAWVAFCVLVVIPLFSGGAPSLFASRYGDAVRHLRHLPAEWLAGRPQWPAPEYTITYLRELLATTGFLGLLNPSGLLVAAPALAINGLSGSTWQHGGGAHYSAEAVPGLLLATIGAVRWLAVRRSPWVAIRPALPPSQSPSAGGSSTERPLQLSQGRATGPSGAPAPWRSTERPLQLSQGGSSSLPQRGRARVGETSAPAAPTEPAAPPLSWLSRLLRLAGLTRISRPAPGTLTLLLALLVLVAALLQARQHGILPPAERFSWEAWATPNGRLVALRPLLARIPADAPVSVQSNLFPHLSNRQRIYVFPAIEDAQFVLVDVAGTSDPLYPDDLFTEVNVLLSRNQFTLLDAVDGFLLFERAPSTRPATGVSAGAGIGVGASLPDQFLSFARPTGPGLETAPAMATFGGLFDVVGFQARSVPEVNFAIRRVTPIIRLRARGVTGQAYRITTFRTGRDGLARIHDDGTPAQLWYPTYRWRPGEVVELRYPPLTYGPGESLGVGIQIGIDPDVPRLRVTGATVPAADGGRVAVLGRLP